MNTEILHRTAEPAVVRKNGVKGRSGGSYALALLVVIAASRRI